MAGKLRVINGRCPECLLRISRRERPSGGYDEGADETQPKCEHGDYHHCPRFREAMSELRAKTPPQRQR